MSIQSSIVINRPDKKGNQSGFIAGPVYTFAGQANNRYEHGTVGPEKNSSSVPGFFCTDIPKQSNRFK